MTAHHFTGTSALAASLNRAAIITGLIVLILGLGFALGCESGKRSVVCPEVSQ